MMRTLSAGLAAVLFAATVEAGDATGFVTSISAGNDVNVVLFALSGENAEKPRCNESDRYALSLNTAGGLAAYQALLEAKRNKYVVEVRGTNVCKFYWKAEDVLNLTIQ